MAIVKIRRERPGDQAAIRAVHAAAFAQDASSEPAEVGLVDALRDCDGWLPALSLVAEIDGAIVGHNVCSRGHVERDGLAPVACVGLGPIGINPQTQGTGVGSALMWAMIGAAEALEEPLIALLGAPDYYRRFGFVASSELGIEPPDAAWGHFFQALPLTAWESSIAGRFAYAAPFDDLAE